MKTTTAQTQQIAIKPRTIAIKPTVAGQPMRSPMHTPAPQQPSSNGPKIRYPSFMVPLIKIGPDGKPMLAGTISSSLCESAPSWNQIISQNNLFSKGFPQMTTTPPTSPTLPVSHAPMNAADFLMRSMPPYPTPPQTPRPETHKKAPPPVKPQKVTRRRIRFKSPLLFNLANDISSARVLGRVQMNAQQLGAALERVDLALSKLERIVAADPSLSTQYRSTISQLRRIKHKYKRVLQLQKTRFDLDTWMSSHIKDDKVTPLEDIVLPASWTAPPVIVNPVNRVELKLDDALISDEPIEFERSFKRKLLGNPLASQHLDFISTTSPFSGRNLPTFLWRDFDSVPPMKQTFNSILSRSGAVSQLSIDYAYLRPHHVPQLNEMLCRLFWPHIDITPDLSCPENAIVVLYGRKVIGCGMLDSSVGHNYITYLAVDIGWRGVGIASKLMYFLTRIQKKDITLHVQPTNWNAMKLYQKWGFKAEKFLVGFYDRYVPWKNGEGPGEWSTRGSRNSLYMRLRQ